MKYGKTEFGQQAFKARSAALTPRQRSAFILFDGRKSVDEVLAMTAGLGVSAIDVHSMVSAGLLELVGRAVPLPRLETEPLPLETAVGFTPAQRFARAWPIATRITASLGLRGFRLNLAVEGAAGYEQLRDLLPKIRDAVGAEKALELELALKE